MSVKSKRIVFTFDERTRKMLEDLKIDGHYKSLSEVVKDALRIKNGLHAQSKQGYTEIIVRDPKTNKEKVMIE